MPLVQAEDAYWPDGGVTHSTGAGAAGPGLGGSRLERPVAGTSRSWNTRRQLRAVEVLVLCDRARERATALEWRVGSMGFGCTDILRLLLLLELTLSAATRQRFDNSTVTKSRMRLFAFHVK